MRFLLKHTQLSVAGFSLLTLLGCEFPSDPSGSVKRIDSSVIRVGISSNPPWTTFKDNYAGGLEAELLERMAQDHGAPIEWTHDMEAALIESLYGGDLDLVIAVLKKDTPWFKRAGLTRPYYEDHVMAVTLGENRWLLTLDKFLQKNRHAIEEQIKRMCPAPNFSNTGYESNGWVIPPGGWSGGEG